MIGKVRKLLRDQGVAEQMSSKQCNKKVELNELYAYFTR